MAKFIMLIGPAGCGKSTYAKQLHSEDSNSVILSSDAMRKELFDDETYQGDNQRVFKNLIRRARKYLTEGINVIWDATSMGRKNRIGILEQLPAGTIAHAIIISATIDEIINQDSLRDRTVGKKVIMKHLMSFEPPWFSEGFSTIRVVGASGYSRESLITAMKNCQHENPHHRPGSIYDHCDAMRTACVYDNIKNKDVGLNDYILQEACMYHDCGKPFVKFYDEDGIAHYHGHDGVGAYVFTTTLRNDVQPIMYGRHDKFLKVAVMIGEHMNMHQKQFRLDRLERRVGAEIVDLCKRLKFYDENYS